MPSHGDRHNFGRTVRRLPDGWYHKPRTLYWEWLLLASDSHFRLALDAALTPTLGDRSPLAVMPALRFVPDGGDLNTGGRVEDALTLVKSVRRDAILDAADAERFGSWLALTAWLGVADLHRDNVLVGRSASDQLVILMLDVECCLHDFLLPAQTQALPGAGLDSAIAGLGDVVAAVGSRGTEPLIAAAVAGYVACLHALLAAEDVLAASLLSDERALTSPLRILPRKTKTYEALIATPPERRTEHTSHTSPLLPEETLAIDRGDVPYFFRFLDSGELFHWRAPLQQAVLAPGHEPITGGATRFLRTASKSSGIWTLAPRTNGSTLLQGGALSLAKLLLTGSTSYASTHKSKDGDLELRLESGYLEINHRHVAARTRV